MNEASPGPVVLVTRPLDAGRKTAAALEARGWRPLLWPLLEIAPLPAPASLGAAQAVLATSANAFCAVAGDARAALCVGAATAAAARAAGFSDARSADGDASALAALARQSLRPQDGPLLFLRGSVLAADLAADLREAGFEVIEHLAYESRPAGPPPQPVRAALAGGAVAAAVFHSPRAASLFATHASNFAPGLRRTAAVAISNAAASPLQGCGFAQITVADHPDGAAVCEALARLASAPPVPEK